MAGRPSLFHVALLAIAVALGTAGAAGAHGSSVGFVFAPNRAVQGADASVGVRVRPAGVRCKLVVSYANGATQSGLEPVTASNGHATWTWHVGLDAATGVARVYAVCGRAGSVMRKVMVVGKVTPVRISVAKQGFSTRPQRFGGGTDVSYGVVLSNDTPGQDALNLSVLVNFVGPNDHLIGSATSSIDAIPAGGQYALGSSMSFPGAAPIVRLETVIQVGSHQPSSLHYPVVSNIYLEPGFDAAWLGAVDGEISNVDPAQVLRYTGLSAVVFDASGNVIGGGTGTAFASLPPGAREFFKATSGFDAIPLGQAASAMVSLTPTWAN